MSCGLLSEAGTDTENTLFILRGSWNNPKQELVAQTQATAMFLQGVDGGTSCFGNRTNGTWGSSGKNVVRDDPMASVLNSWTGGGAFS